MNKLTISISLALVITILPLSSEVFAKKAWSVTSCKLARASNRAAKNWSVMPKPNNDKQYQNWINSSPWCSWADGNASNHKLILHHSSSGATQSVEIHKMGAQEWIKDNMGKLSRICSIPRNWTKRKLKYTDGSYCFVEVREGPWTPYLHQWAVPGPNSKRKHKGLPAIKFPFKKRR